MVPPVRFSFTSVANLSLPADSVVLFLYPYAPFTPVSFSYHCCCTPSLCRGLASLCLYFVCSAIGWTRFHRSIHINATVAAHPPIPRVIVVSSLTRIPPQLPRPGLRFRLCQSLRRPPLLDDPSHRYDHVFCPSF